MPSPFLLFLALCAISFLLIYSYGSFEVEKLGFFDLVLLGLSNSKLGLFMLRLFCIYESSSGSSASGAITREGHHRSKSTPANRQWRQFEISSVLFSWKPFASPGLLPPARNFVAYPALSILISKWGSDVVRSVLTIACLTTVGFSAAFAETKPTSAVQQNLKSPSEFRSIANQKDRSRAIFTELGKLLTNPRCMNCHPAGDHPLQGAEHREHLPPVWRGEAGAGVPGASCAMCHTESNFTLHEAATYQSIPGHPRWQLAPLSMSWEGKTLGDICRQLKDTNRNGGRDLAALQEHVAKDDLVAWGWNPGPGREPAPSSQEAAGELFQAWIDSGANCP
jgi:hypothetical protein